MTLESVKHMLVNVTALLVPTRRLRRRFRRAVMHFHFRDLFELRRFKRGCVRLNFVLLVETNATHGEVIAGYLKYFQELGFAVDVLINSELLKECPFCRAQLAGVGVFSCYYGAFGRFFATQRFGEYAHVVLMSSAGYRWIDGEESASVAAHFGLEGKAKSLLVVEHDLNNIERFGERDLLAQGRLLTLGRFGRGVFAAPFLFGEVAVTPRGDVATFVCVGGIERERKNHAALEAAVREVAARRRDFRVVVIGRGEMDDLPEEVRPFVEIAGRLDFPAMFKRMEQADFYLPLLDPSDPAHERYITTGVTGSAQLIYAFGKIPVIHPKFATFYDFDDGNAVVTENLADGMLAAIVLSRDDYARRQAALLELAERLKAQSFANLRNVVLAGGGHLHD